jgi:hypothetical protein
MRLRNAILLFFVLYAFFPRTARAQDSSLYFKLYSLPDKSLNRINAGATNIEKKLTRQTLKYLARLERHEKKLHQKLWKKDSTAAKELFGDINARYASLQSISGSQNYSSKLDSLQTMFKFLEQNSFSNKSAAEKQKLQSVLRGYDLLQSRLNQTDAIKKYLKERQQYLRLHLQRFGLTKGFRQYSKTIYYYRAQVAEYKKIWEDPSRLEEKLLELANKIPAFKDFFSKNSMLAAMFRLPGTAATASATPIPGLQTRSSIQQNMLARFGTGPDVNRTLQQNMQSAQAQINQLKDKVNQLGGGSSDMDMPDFKPNSQKTKSFSKRIELSANIQSMKSNGYFPVTSDLGLSVGYKMSDRSVAGVGVSYKIGWGQTMRYIKITHEGIGLRSFLDIQLKGSFYASGGFEYNFQQPFQSVRQLYGLDSWHQSGLIGVSKVVSVRSQMFKKTKVQLLWDFLSYQQSPRQQPLKFRIGYSF